MAVHAIETRLHPYRRLGDGAHRVQARHLIVIHRYSTFTGLRIMINTSAFPAVAVTLWTLGAFSVATWTLILLKSIQLILNARSNGRFGKQFWSAANLQAAADLSAHKEDNSRALGRLAGVGFGVLNAPSHSEEHDLQHSWDRHEQLQRNLAQQLKRERRTLDAGLAVLASIGSTAPFVGLFGTVWGIMSAMHDISKNGNASIDVVAGPIGEGPVCTGKGISGALPPRGAF